MTTLQATGNSSFGSLQRLLAQLNASIALDGLANTTLGSNTSHGGAGNASSTAPTSVGFEARFGLLQIVLTSLLLGIMILCTIVGNVFVVAAIILERNLQCVSNYLILSLAVADLMVATLVMPICALKEMSRVWWLGIHLCDLWTCLDVLCCTASILHLVGIAMDRYWAVTDVNYIRARTGRRIGGMIALVWVISAMISAPARFWFSYMDKQPDECRINESAAYTVFSTVGAFYLPMLFMIIIYLRIYHAARKRIRRKAFKPPPSTSTAAATTASQPSSAKIKAQQKQEKQRNQRQEGKQQTGETPAADTAAPMPGPAVCAVSSGSDTPEGSSGAYQTTSFAGRQQPQQQKQQQQQQNGRAEAQERLTVQSKAAMQRQRLEEKRERKAARTLAIITGCFLVCWFPFFLRAIVCPFYAPLCTDIISEMGHSLIQWLGYTNSLLNPVIYTIFSPDFRSAFSKILFGRYRRR